MRKWHDGIELVRKLRSDGKSLVEICKETGVSKSTVYGWIKDMPVPDRVVENRNKMALGNLERGRRDTQWKWREKREKATRVGWEESEVVIQDREIRDFLCLYLGEGDKRSRGTAGLVNTDPSIIILAHRMLEKLSGKVPTCRLICSLGEKKDLLRFWMDVVGVKEGDIKFTEKKKKNKRRAEYGLFTVEVYNTDFKCRLMSWIDRLKLEWKS